MPMPDEIKQGMTWHIDGHQFEVTEMYDGECQITETWLSEDNGHECRVAKKFKIAADNGGHQYAYDPECEKYANPGANEYSWWARKYACGADYIK